MNKILYICLPLMLLCLGYTMYQDSLKNALSSGKGSYVSDLMCAIEANTERSVEDMTKDFSECIELHLSHQITD